MEDSLDTIQKILNSKKIRYDKMKELFDTVSPSFKFVGQNVNIFIDLSAVVKQLYNPDTLGHLNYIKDQDRIMISSEIINIVGHYRHYFASRHQMSTTFYFTHSFASSNYHRSIESTYRADFYLKRNSMNNPLFGPLNKIVMANMKMAKTIINYIPNCFFIDSGVIEPTVIPHFIIKYMTDKENINLILTNDDVFYQDLLLSERTFILEMRGSEKSNLIDQHGLIETLLSSSKKNAVDFPNTNFNVMPIIDGMVSHKIYGINSVGRRGYSSAIPAIEKEFKKGNIDELRLTDYQYIMEDLAPLLFPDETKQEEFKKHIKLFNHSLITDTLYDSIKNRVEGQLVTLENHANLMELNTTVFNRFPINLPYAFEGEDDSARI